MKFPPIAPPASKPPIHQPSTINDDKNTTNMTGAAAKTALVDTGVDKKVLRNLWPLADMDRDGACLRACVLAFMFAGLYVCPGP